MITDGCLDSVSVNELAGSLGVTPRHLRRVMIDEVGAPPIAVARAHRAQTARTLIETTDMTFTDVTFASGFQSQRQFNDTVKAVFAETPTELRAKSRSGIAVSSGELRLRLAHRLPIASAYLLGWAAHRCVAGVSQVDGETLRTALRLPHGGGTVELRFDEGFVDCRLRLDEVRDVGEAVRQCRAMLDLDCDPTAIDAALGALKPLRPLVKSRPGLRSPGSTDGFATLAFAVLGQQRSVAAARTLAGRIVARVRAHAGAGTEELVPFPSPEVLAETDLGDLGLTTRGIHTLHAISRQWAGRTNELSPSGDRNSVRSELLTVSGIGPWTADYVLMRVMADPDIWLGGDLVAARSANALGLRAEELRLISPWRSYATHHLWATSNPESLKD